MTELSGKDHPVKRLEQLMTQLLGNIGVVEAEPEDGQHRGQQCGNALLSEEHPQERLLQRCRTLEPVHLVASHRVKKLFLKTRRQAGLGDVHGSQEGVEELTRAVAVLGHLVRTSAPVPVEQNYTDEGVEDSQLEPHSTGVARSQL